MKEVDKFDDLPACGYPALGGRIYRSVSLKQETRARYTVNGSNDFDIPWDWRAQLQNR
jgi:hypothetical protein